MDKNLHLSNLKKNMKNFETKEDIINIKKDKILSLRKKKNKKYDFNRILGEKEKEEEIKYKIYEFDESEILSTREKYMNKNDIFNISFEKIYKSNPYKDDDFKFWLYSMYRKSNKGKNEKILKSFSKEKLRFLINILVDSSQFNISNNNSIDLNQIKENIKFKYTICSILINLLFDTDKYNQIFIEKIMDIYNFIIILIQIYQNWKDNSFLILISHYQWIINNLIQDDKDDVYKKIIKKYPNINFPQLIQNIFLLDNIELYQNNIRMLIIYLSLQEEAETFFQYNEFISNLENIISLSIQTNNVQIIIDAYKALKFLLSSEANCKLVLENKQYIKLISKIVSGYNSISLCDCCLTRLIKHDHNNIINDNYQIYKILLDIIFKKISSNKNTIKHSLKMLRLIINNKNGFNIINYIVNSYTKNIFIQLQHLYFEKPYDLLIQSEVFNFLYTIFNLANNVFKSNLIANSLHIFTLNCLESCYQEFIEDNKDNDSYNKLIVQMLKLLCIILKFGEGDLSMKIGLKNCCEEKNIYHILTELNYSKNKEIQDLIEYLNINFFEGYENEEFDDDEDNNKDL